MNGRDFLDSARRLAERPDAADQRSATSRAYYAAFHAVRDFFYRSGISFSSGSPEAHTKMPQCLENSNIDQAAEMGRRLSSLRADRNTADYDMGDASFEKQGNTQLRLQIAAEIIASVDSLLEEPTRPNVIRILRSKAKQIGLNVIDLN